ncbi:DNA polymerase III subunit gamma/tau [Sphingomonas sp. BGYR3]|uniref:DNA polymerase III subunit gamma/tau n=1 Tax=Sphingomonas sp. BGYR3 TaxID=2975483 RepID=UPI0021A7A25A|nr:DNA polymerase III subunit gamma/tau [Sphingomonas sp. BGYR3]MDG5487562.1 DNA polymerase III subunit gamma/tau [Sphingomonas sp. BGYR3]
MSDSFDLGEPPQPRDAAYRVLARKYRPQTFSQLIGQDAMVQTLGNAIRRDRLAHAFLLTGVRGVGKTSTARLIAKALNCVGPDGQGGPTIDPCGVCSHCINIAAGRDMDVIEMDAASNRGIDGVREVINIVRTGPNIARFLVYIIDEVHMMTKEAFNALLKTLEEPPSRVKFLFATTEVDKVPVTVLSRCQRFDLRRIPAELLAEHFQKVTAAEGFEAEPEALGLIARAAEGSARDGLSILDQAIAHAGMEGGGVSAEAVRQMLGLSDRGAIRALLGHLLAGDAQAALAGLRGQYDLGVDPLAVLRTLLETVHAVTLTKIGADSGVARSAEEQAALEEWAAGLTHARLHRLWQLLLRAHDEVTRAALPIEACEMALLRIVHAAELPDPGTLARMIRGGEVTLPAEAPAVPAAAAAPSARAAEPAPAAAATAATDPAMPPLPATLADMVDLLTDRGFGQIAAQVRNLLRPVRYAPPALEISSARPLPAELVGELTRALRDSTSTAWSVTLVAAEGDPTLREQEEQAADARRAAILASPLVAAAMAAFPGAKLVD